MLLENGTLIKISRDEFTEYLRGVLCERDRLQLENIAYYSFDRGAAAVFEFVSAVHGNHQCIGYMPVFDDKELWKQNAGRFGSIEQSLYLGSFAVGNLDELEDKELLAAIKKRAFHLAFWEEKDCAILVLR